MSRVNIHIYPSPITHESRILKETETLARLGVSDEIYIIGLWSEGLPEQEDIDERRKILRVRLWSRALGRTPLARPLKLLEWTLRIVWKFLPAQVNVVNVHNLDVLPIGCLFKILKGSTLVYDTHELETERNGLNGRTKPLAKLAEKTCMPLVDKIIAVSPSIGDWYQQRYGKPTFTILNAPKLTKVGRKDLLRKHLNIPDEKIVFLYQGAFLKGRGIEKILEAFIGARLTDKVVVFMGYGPLKEMIVQAASCHAGIYFHDAVPPEKVLEYTASADIGFSLIENTCLSYYYSLPNKVFEYAMAEIPVIVPGFIEMEKLVRENRIGYVLKDDSNHAVIELIDSIDRESLDSFKPHLTSFKKIYNWENQEATLASIYKDQLQGPRK